MLTKQGCLQVLGPQAWEDGSASTETGKVRGAWVWGEDGELGLESGAGDVSGTRFKEPFKGDGGSLREYRSIKASR